MPSSIPQRGAGPVLTIRLLGLPQLQQPDGGALPLERRVAALLAVLALEGPSPRGRLAAMLWPDASAEQARGNLRQRLFRLRREARCEVVVGTDTLRLADGVAVDLDSMAASLANDAQAALGDLLGAHDYSDGEALDAWARSARERWRAGRLDRLAQLAGEHEARQQLAAALLYAQRIVADEPLLEHAHRRVMRLHYLRGDRAAALDAYDRCRQVLRHELGMTPDRETNELAETIERSGARPPTAPAPRAITTLRPPRLIGREGPWKALQALADRSGVGLVSGEAGIGKTRLIADFADPRADACLVRAWPGDARLPYALMARIVRALAQRFELPPDASADWARAELARIAPELGTPPATRLEPLRLQQAVLQLLKGWNGVGLSLLCIDDLHYADDATLEMFAPLASADRELRVGWIFAARAHELPASLATWLAAQEADHVQRIALGPLDEAAVQALLASLEIPELDAARWAAPLTRHTGGNPMFILETLLSLTEQGLGALEAAPSALPLTVRVGQQIERRLALLSAPALKLARLAAIAGQDFDAELATQVLGVHALDIADAWRELEAALIIRDDAFAHDLIAQATAQSVPDAIARVLHRDLAGRLEARGAPAARVALHWFEAGEWERAADHFVEAARAAAKRSRRVEEAEWLERAADGYVRAQAPEKAFQVRCDAMDALRSCRSDEQVLAAGVSLIADARTDQERHAALVAHAWTVLLSHGAVEGLALATEALDIARRLGQPPLELDAALAAAYGLGLADRAAEGLALLAPFEAEVEASGDVPRRSRYWSALAPVLHLARRYRDSVDAWQKAATLAVGLGDLSEAATCRSAQVGLEMVLGRPERAHAAAEEGQRLQAATGERQGPVAGAVDLNLAICDALLGRFDTCLDGLQIALAKFQAPSALTWKAICESHTANTWLLLGQTARAAQAITPVSDQVWYPTRAKRLVVEGRIEQALGRSASQHFEQALALLGDRDHGDMRVLIELDLGRDLAPAACASRCQDVRARAEAGENLSAAMKARIFEIEAWSRGGSPAGPAAELAADAWARFAECRPCDLYRPAALWVIHRALALAGEAALGDTVLREAVRWIEHDALPRVPPAFRDSFLNRNPTNRAVLAEARRRITLP